MQNVFLEVRNITKTFDGVRALDNVSLTVHEGEVLSLAGENGCGKSTLIKVISGVHEPDSGEVILDGHIYAKLTPAISIHHGVQVIYQDFSVFPNLSVAENIVLTSEIERNSHFRNWKKIRKTAVGIMKRIGVEIDPDAILETLSVANKQIVAICRALLCKARLIIMDEPTTALTAHEIERLFDIIRELKKDNIAIILVNHKLEEVYEAADTLTILRGGKNVAYGAITEFDRSRFVRYMTGRDIEEAPYRHASEGKPVFSVERLSRRGAFEDISFELRKKDILGITGLLGSGRGEIGDALFGIQPADSGKIFLDGKEIVIKNPQNAMDNAIAYVPEDRLTQGLFLPKSICINTVVSSLKKYSAKGRLDWKEIHRNVIQWISSLKIDTDDSGKAASSLSGGNQQKLVIAKWLNSKPRLLILNQPTAGVDVGAKADIHNIIKELAGQNMGVIIISDDLPELVCNCNRVLIMRRGQLCAVCENNEISEDRLAELIKQDAV